MGAGFASNELTAASLTGDRRARRSAEAEDLKGPSGYELIPDKDLMQMPPLLRSNARSLATDVTDRRDRRVDESSSTACLLLSYEHQTHPDPGGFSVPREHIGRLPLLPPSVPSESMGEAHLKAWSPGG